MPGSGVGERCPGGQRRNGPTAGARDETRSDIASYPFLSCQSAHTAAPVGVSWCSENLLVKRVAVILVALAAGVIYADSTDPDLALGYQFLPDLPVGFTLSTDWGVDAKLTAFAYSLVGMTVGYRAPFRDPLGGSVILGLSIANLRPPA